MKTYIVQIKEIVTSTVEVEAESAERAAELVNEGQFDGAKVTDRETYEFPTVLS